MRKFSVFLILFFLFPAVKNPVFSQTISGYWLKNRWNADWIAPVNVSLTDYGVYLFRRTFILIKKPQHFVIHLSGDNRYKLLVNGEEACIGPARGDTRHWNFETIDIAPFLNEGNNTLGAIVWNYGPFMPLAQMSNQTGLIIQGDSAWEEIVNTNTQWKVIVNQAYKPLAMKQYHLTTGPGDRIDGAKYPYGWEDYSFDDGSWDNARLLGKGTPEGKFGESGWFLVPRPIPFMESKLQRLNQVIRTENVMISNEFLSGTKSLRIAPNTSARILLDQAFLTTAYPQLMVTKGKGANIKIMYSEALVNENGEKGNRNDVIVEIPLMLTT